MTKKKIEEWIPDLIRNNKEKERMDFYVRRNDGYLWISSQAENDKKTEMTDKGF